MNFNRERGLSMNCVFVFKNVKASESLKTRLTELFDRFEKINGEKSVKFVISERKTKGKEAKIEANLILNGKLYRAEAFDSSASTPFFAAADKVYEKMKKILRREKDKGLSERKDYSDIKEEAPVIPTIRKKTFELRRISVNEAIKEMEDTDHSFYLFLDEDTDKTSVVYKRNEEGYGLICAL